MESLISVYGGNVVEGSKLLINSVMSCALNNIRDSIRHRRRHFFILAKDQDVFISYLSCFIRPSSCILASLQLRSTRALAAY